MSFNSYEDRQLFAELYEATYAHLINYAKGIVHNDHDAEEIVHDAYVRFAGHFDKYKRKERKMLYGLLLVITRNLSIDLCKKNKRRGDVLVDFNEYAAGIEADELQGVIEDDIVRRSTLESVRNAVAELKQGDRDVIILKYYHELSNSEIGELLSLKTKNVEVRLRRARKRLRDILEKNGVEG
jgi:RNA polymerase sigma-70 factor (ECF subfamily)